MKIRMVLMIIVIIALSTPVFAEDTPRVYTDSDLQNYKSASDDWSDKYYRDKREERYQYYQDKKEAREDDSREREIVESKQRLYLEERERRREACRSEANSKLFWCNAKDKLCRWQWTNAARDCNFID
jgi:hypothetical protein